jgi:hypothetical protein
MVETQEPELVVHSEESQTVFEGALTMLQPPPVDEEKAAKQKKKRARIWLGLLFLTIMLGGMIYLRGNGADVANKPKPTTTPSATPIYIDAAKEAELQRVEAIVESVNPETLLILPPQVNMAIQF